MDIDQTMEIGRRIRNKRVEHNMTQEELGASVGMNKSTVQRYETGQVKKIKLPVLEVIAKKLNVNPEWLACKSDNPEPNIKSSSDYFNQFDNISPVRLKKFRLLGEIACGKPIYAEEDYESYVSADADIKADFCLRAKGDSMINAGINEGDIVFIHEQTIVNDGEIAAVIIEDEVTLKRVYYDQKHNRLQLVAENPIYAPLVYFGEELEYIRILGKAVALMRNL